MGAKQPSYNDKRVSPHRIVRFPGVLRDSSFIRLKSNHGEINDAMLPLFGMLKLGDVLLSQVSNSFATWLPLLAQKTKAREFNLARCDITCTVVLLS